jgi:hypothetical protein
MSAEQWTIFLQHLDAWLPLKIYQCLQGGKFADLPVDRLFHQHKTGWLFGSRNTICFIKYVGGDRLTPADFQAYSTSCYDFACSNPKEWPAGFFAKIVVIFPLIVTDTLSDQARAFVQEYHARHFARFEFPAVYELNPKRLSYCVSMPVYGGALYPGLGKEVEALYTI